MGRLRFAGAVVVVCGVLAPVLTVSAAASANGTLDQQQMSTNVIVSTAGGSFAQTFTAGLTGQLGEVELFLGKSAGTEPLEVQIRNVEATDAPGKEVLAKQTVAPSSSTEWSAIVFSSPAQVVSGTQYAIVVYESPATGSFEWNGEVGNPYTRGAAWFQGEAPPLGKWIEAESVLRFTDFAFKTYVQQLPTSIDQCKKNGWKNFGTMFKNQGQCVKFVETGR
jgi:hypothetical protein